MKRLIIALAAIVALPSQALAEDTSAAEATQCDSCHRRHCHVHLFYLSIARGTQSPDVYIPCLRTLVAELNRLEYRLFLANVMVWTPPTQRH
jgi:hypothetical protein